MANILIIDDDPVMLTTIQYILNREGYNVTITKDGMEAFELLDNYLYDIVITDLMMPKMNGLEVINKLRNNHLNMNIGIVIVSMVNEAASDTALTLGGDYYLHKPIIVEELLIIIRMLLEERQRIIMPKKTSHRDNT